MTNPAASTPGRPVTLTGFLLARISEDEEVAQRESIWPTGTPITPKRVLADCAAKRRLIDLAFENSASIDGEWGCCHNADEIRRGLCPRTPISGIEELQVMAEVFADHPDFDPSWARAAG